MGKERLCKEVTICQTNLIASLQTVYVYLDACLHWETWSQECYGCVHSMLVRHTWSMTHASEVSVDHLVESSISSFDNGQFFLFIVSRLKCLSKIILDLHQIASLAQLAVHLICNQKVGGSRPSGG
jgi:hypothetical protein